MPVKKKRQLTLKNGYFCKYIRGKVHYFGKDTGHASYKKALAQFKREEPYLKLGLKPESENSSLYQMRDLLNSFLEYQMKREANGDIKIATLRDYTGICDRLATALPKTKSLDSLSRQDFEKVREHFYLTLSGVARSPKSVDRDLSYVRQVFKFAYTSELVESPLRYEDPLKGVPKKVLRERRAENQLHRPRSFTPDELRELIKKSEGQLKAQILLGISAGYNRSDIGNLTLNHVKDLSKPIVFPRAKTSFHRVNPLWPETKKALEEWLKIRPKADHDFVFMRPKTNNPIFDSKQRAKVNQIFHNLVVKLGFYSPGKDLSALRTTFANLGAEAGDDVALKALMGHGDGSMLYDSYAYGVYLPRLEAVTSHVRDRVFLGDFKIEREPVHNYAAQ